MEEEERILIETCSLVSVASTNFLIDPPIRPCVAIAFFFCSSVFPFRFTPVCKILPLP